jgi:hypothetical protein
MKAVVTMRSCKRRVRSYLQIVADIKTTGNHKAYSKNAAMMPHVYIRMLVKVA